MLSSKTDIVVHGALDGLAARHRAFVNNIANADTPGFHPEDVPFEEQLRRIRDAANPSQAASTTLSLEPVADNQHVDRADGNGVQIDDQVVRLEENSLTYQALAQAARIREAMLLSAVSEGHK